MWALIFILCLNYVWGSSLLESLFNKVVYRNVILKLLLPKGRKILHVSVLKVISTWYKHLKAKTIPKQKQKKSSFYVTAIPFILNFFSPLISIAVGQQFLWLYRRFEHDLFQICHLEG